MRHLDGFIARLAQRRHRLIGLSLLRVLLGIAAMLFYLSDYTHRQFLWGPQSYDSPALSGRQLTGGLFSAYLFSNSQFWFEAVFHLGLLVAALFTIFGGRGLTVLQAVFMWSIYNRNQDVLEGGDNLARILLIFMIFCTTNAYFSPGSRARRERLAAAEGGYSLRVLIHNLAAFLIVFQVCSVYFFAGLNKIIGTIWQDGVATYYISRIPAFHGSGLYANLMSQPFIGTVTSYMTILIELAFPFAILSSRAWIRKANVLMIETMHLGIIAFMSLVCFGIIMIGADCSVLTDQDFRDLHERARDLLARIQRGRSRVVGEQRLAEPAGINAG